MTQDQTELEKLAEEYFCETIGPNNTGHHMHDHSINAFKAGYTACESKIKSLCGASQRQSIH